MKKKMLGMITALAATFAFGGCEVALLQRILGDSNFSDLVSGINSIEKEEEKLDSWLDSLISDNTSEELEDETPEQPEDPDDGETPEQPQQPDDEEEIKTYLYTAFTAKEKGLFETYVGEVIPFLANNEYYVEGYNDETDYENGMCFYTIGNTQGEFDAYRALYSAYTLTETMEDEDGDTWYTYEKGDLVVDMCYYYDEGENWLVVYVASVEESGGENPDVEDPDQGEDTDGYTYHDFTDEEKALFETYVGEVIPFISNDEYYVGGYYEDEDYENGMSFYVIGVTEIGFQFYRAYYSDYTLTDTYEDELGETWYTYKKGDLIVDMCHYYEDDEYQLVVYVCSTGEVGGETPDGGEDIPEDDDEVVEDGAGVREVDFTKATKVKDVTDQGYYVDGCPTKGAVKVLVIPVEFSDVTAASKGYTTEKLNTIFNGASGSTDYYSVAEYYDISSHGQLDLEFVVLDNWFRPSEKSSYYKTLTMDYDGESMDIGDQKIMDEALAYLESRMDLTQFDSDGNDIIDAVVMINTLEIDSEYNFNWAYRYWNYYTDNNDYYYEYDGVSANDYMWASYQFMLEEYDDFGNVSYNKNNMNPYTYIHEFAHILGADDYYDTSTTEEYGPLDGYDMMDAMMGDHNPFTKFNYGWLTTARLITAQESVTLTLESFTKTGDAVIIANNWDDKLGAYQEYYVVVYYTNTGLNAGEGGFFADEGILVYHVNAALTTEVYGGETYYNLAYNNTDPSDEYGTTYNLIELVKSADGNYVYEEYDSLPATEKTDKGQKIAYVLTVNRITEDGATVTFRVNN